MWKSRSVSTKEKTIQDISLLLGFCILPWDCEIWVETMSFTAKLWYMAGLWQAVSYRIFSNKRPSPINAQYDPKNIL